MLCLNGKREKLSNKEIEDLKLDLYIEMCLKIIPFLDDIYAKRNSEESVKKLILEKDKINED